MFWTLYRQDILRFTTIHASATLNCNFLRFETNSQTIVLVNFEKLIIFGQIYQACVELLKKNIDIPL